MGTWGAGPFDSDPAADFVDWLAEPSAAQRAQLIESRLVRAVSDGPDRLPGEVLAAAAVVAASLRAGRDLPWNDDYPGIDSWLRGADLDSLGSLAARALDETFPPDGWYWQSWVDESERREARTVLEMLRGVLIPSAR